MRGKNLSDMWKTNSTMIEVSLFLSGIALNVKAIQSKDKDWQNSKKCMIHLYAVYKGLNI